MRQLLVAITIMVPLLLSAAETPDAGLVGTWVQPPWTNGMPAAQEIKWLSLTFQTNEVVRWEWMRIRNGKTDTHSGVIAKIEKASASQSGREDQTIRIFPDRSDLFTMVLKSVRVVLDNRFPADWRVLKFKFGEQESEEESFVLVREEDVLRTSGPSVRAPARP